MTPLSGKLHKILFFLNLSISYLMISSLTGCSDLRSNDKKEKKTQDGQSSSSPPPAGEVVNIPPSATVGETHGDEDKDAPAADQGLPEQCSAEEVSGKTYNQCITCTVKSLAIDRCFKAAESFDASKDCKHNPAQIICTAKKGEFHYKFNKLFEPKVLVLLPFALRKAEKLIEEKITNANDKSIALAAIEFTRENSKAIILAKDPAKLADQLTTSLSEASEKLKSDTATLDKIKSTAKGLLEFYGELRKTGKVTLQDGLKLLVKIRELLPKGVGDLLKDLEAVDFLSELGLS